ncbi:MAG: beta-propeller fold lactonase family protein [Bacteriovoracia bacterium]
MLYAVNSTSLWSYKIFPGDGTLIKVASSDFTHASSTDFSVLGNTDWAYVADYTDSKIHKFRLNSRDGSLAYVNAKSISTPSQIIASPTALQVFYVNFVSTLSRTITIDTNGDKVANGAIDSSGGVLGMGYFEDLERLVVSGFSANLAYIYSVDADGLHALSTSPTTHCGACRWLMDSTRAFLVGYNVNSNAIEVFSMDYETGVLTSLHAMPSAVGCKYGLAHPSLPVIYLQNNTEVRVYRIDTDTGALSAVQTLTLSNDANVLNNSSMTIEPNGVFFYLPRSIQNEIQIYSIDPSTGALTYSSTQPVAGFSVIKAVRRALPERVP